MLTFQSFMRGQGDIKEGKCTREQVNGYWRNICVITYSHPEVAVKEPVSHKMAGVSYPPRLVFQSGYSNKSSPMLRKNLNSLGAGYKYFLDFHNMIFKDYSCKRCKILVKKWKKTCKNKYSAIFPLLTLLYLRYICVRCQELNTPDKSGIWESSNGHGDISFPHFLKIEKICVGYLPLPQSFFPISFWRKLKCAMT